MSRRKLSATSRKRLKQNVIIEGLGICYEMGIGVEDNETEAFKYYTLAAGSGNVMSMYRTGLCYYNGVGVKQEIVRKLTDGLMMPPEMTMWLRIII